MAPDAKAAPIYVVDRTDVVRVFVDIPERDANYVHEGSKASVLAKAFRDQPIAGIVSRTAWALNVKSRTLRAEIDLPNTGDAEPPADLPQQVRDALTKVKMPDTESQILPGMYAYGKVMIECPQVLSVPVSALTHDGDRTYCWTYDQGKSVQTEIQVGVSDGERIQVLNRRTRPTGTKIVPASFPPQAQNDLPVAPALDDALWLPFDGSERVILGDLSILTDGGSVLVDDDQCALTPAAQDADAAEHASRRK